MDDRSISGNGISIHALREEGDLLGFIALELAEHISIHALREEGDAGFLCGGMR